MANGERSGCWPEYVGEATNSLTVTGQQERADAFSSELQVLRAEVGTRGRGRFQWPKGITRKEARRLARDRAKQSLRQQKAGRVSAQPSAAEKARWAAAGVSK